MRDNACVCTGRGRKLSGVISADRKQPQLVIFTGLQASGKSTFYKARFAHTHRHVSKDLLRNAKNRNRRQLQLIEAALGEGLSVVVDNTNATAEDRAALIAMGRAFGAEIIGYYFESRVSEALARNQQREGDARVPDVAIFATIKKLQRPAYNEGFDRLFYVRIKGDNEFEVSDWQEENDGERR